MINLLIADDEPLIQAGIKSMINWEEYDIHIIGAATNGAAAYEMIKEHSPEIVITDIKMPVMSGLELAKKCYEEERLLPVFIILTSYEEFQFVKEALSYQVIDYLVKLELSPDVLGDSLKRAISRVSELLASSQVSESAYNNLYVLREQFFTRLVLNLFESKQQFDLQADNLNIDFSYSSYTACHVEIRSSKLNDMTAEKQLTLYTSSIQMAEELISKYAPCHVLSLDTKHFCIVFFLNEENAADYRNVIRNVIEQVSAMLFNYYSVTIHTGIGSPVTAPMQIASSYQDAKQAFSQITRENPILFFEDITLNRDYKNHIVINVKKYINEHIKEKLTLNNVAEVFNISPNYLSVLFSKYNDTGFTDYINRGKIEEAKKMLSGGDYKIYEISDVLGFESAFYFSRVFKKITGVSPRDYMSKNL